MLPCGIFANAMGTECNRKRPRDDKAVVASRWKKKGRKKRKGPEMRPNRHGMLSREERKEKREGDRHFVAPGQKMGENKKKEGRSEGRGKEGGGSGGLRLRLEWEGGGDTKGATHRYGSEAMRKKGGEIEGGEVPGSTDVNKHLLNATAEPQGAPALRTSESRSASSTS